MPKQSTLRQRKVAELLVVNGGKKIGEVMKMAGYSEAIQHNPHKVMKSQGLQAILEECGLTETLVAQSLADDIKAKPQQRVKELALAADILRMKQSGVGNVAVQVNVGDDRNKYE